MDGILWVTVCAVTPESLLVHLQNQKDRNVYRTPITEYFIWPKVDAWEEVKAALDAKPWIPDRQAGIPIAVYLVRPLQLCKYKLSELCLIVNRDTILVLNSLTDIVNYWQELHTKADAQEKFGDQVTFEA